MNKAASKRILSLDLLKGLVMVIMALDHTRDYFHNAAFLFEPTDPLFTDVPMYLTRWITHFCAPAFSFLAGLSAFLVGRRKTGKELSSFLLKRGLWLAIIEVTIVNFSWYFDIHFSYVTLLVIWSLGISMILLAGLIHLPSKLILIFSLIIIFGHHLLDDIDFEHSILWSLIHKEGGFTLANGTYMYIGYPILPWAGVMSLGYYFGSFYNREFEPGRRQHVFKILGFATIALFIVVRMSNQYGNSSHWQNYDTLLQTLYSIFNPAKYPPSLSYLLMTLGPTFLFLSYAEKWKGKIVEFFSVFGRVPFFYYIVHIYVIHFFALLMAEFTGFGWQKMILTEWVTETESLKGYGLDLWIVYLIWVGIIILLYPLCKRFGTYKMNHKEKWWLSYF
jgi:uncharacterized membrane protein